MNETHGPYQFGGWNLTEAPVNGGHSLKHEKPTPAGHVPSGGTALFEPFLLPNEIPQTCSGSWLAAGCMWGSRCDAVGAEHPGTFASEFGSVGMSSFEIMSGALSPEHWGVHAGHDMWSQRNYRKC
eukprot:SAG22_NODE_444_length_10453_cov_8.586343_4_plen_126_part_00